MSTEVKPAKLTPGKIRKMLDTSAIKVVHAYIKRYFETKEDDDQGHQKNEEVLLEELLNIYDPEETEKPTL